MIGSARQFRRRFILCCFLATAFASMPATGHDRVAVPAALHAPSDGRVPIMRPHVVSTLDSDSVDVRPGQKTYLEPNSPNPMRTFTRIGFSIEAETQVRLTVYDFFFRTITTLVDEVRPAGRYVEEFRPRGIPSGMYFYELETSQGKQLRRLLYVR